MGEFSTSAHSNLQEVREGDFRFITGMARAGTQWMTKCLNEHPDVAAFGESMFFGRRYVAPAEDGRYHEEQFGELRRRLTEHGTCIHSTAGQGPGSLKRLSLQSLPPLIDRLFPDRSEPVTPGEAFARLTQAIAEAEGKQIAIEKTPHHLNWIDRILAHLPGARFIVMVRDPYTFMLSYKHLGDRKSLRVRRALAKRYHPAAIAMIWKTSMKAAIAAQAQHPERALLVRFDDLRRDPHATLERVQQFFGLRIMNLADRVPPDNTSFAGGVRPALKPEDLFWMRLVAGRAMTGHGYAPQAVPLAPLRIGWSMLRLPWWGLRNYFSLRGRISGSTLGYLLRWLKPSWGEGGVSREMEE